MTGKDQRRDREERHEPHAPYEWHEPMQDEQEHTDTHAGNGTVNDGPDELAPEAAAPDGRAHDGQDSDGNSPLRFGAFGALGAFGGGDRGRDGNDGPEGPDSLGLDGLDQDELALRAMLHGAVDDMQPRDGVLDHLRRAVPARRVRKRQALVGMAAAALFIGTAVPALLHVSNVTGSDADPSIVGSSSQAQGGTGQDKKPDGGSGGSGGSSGHSKGNGSSGGQSGDKGKGSGGGNSSGGGTSASASPGTSVPLCTAAQLGSATSTVASPDSAGIVYGTFRVVNVSGSNCTVGSEGTVGTAAQGAADAAKISVVQHTSGDAATGLPDPSTEASQLLLQPGAAYEVKFAWVPSETCPTNGGTDPSTSPDPSPSTSTDTTGTTGGNTGVTTQLFTEDGTTDGSVVVSHTTAAGSPTVSATVSGACAGTVYRTGVLPAS